MNFFSALFLLSSVNGLFLVLILIIRGLKKVTSNVFLAFLLLIISGYQIKELLILEGYFEMFPHLMAAFVPAFYLLGPIYYFYVKFSLEQKIKFNRKDALHLIPAIICFLTILPFYLKSGAAKLSLYSAPHPEDFELPPNRLAFYGLMLLSMFFYVFKSLSIINSRDKFIDKRTIKSVQATVKWLKYYTWSFLLFLFVFLAAQLIFIFTNFYQYYVRLSTILASAILIHFVGYWAVKESRITNGDNTNSKKSALSGKKINELKASIIEMLEVDKMYLQHNLNAKHFCDHLSINTQYLSQLVNQEFNCSLTHLINSYRIEEAKRLIKSETHTHLNFLGIAFDSGFNSKNTFTRTFKRHVELTPSEYKKLKFS